MVHVMTMARAIVILDTMVMIVPVVLRTLFPIQIASVRPSLSPLSLSQNGIFYLFIYLPFRLHERIQLQQLWFVWRRWLVQM